MTPEYFSALNEADAKEYIGKIMEFADRQDIRSETEWVKRKFVGSTRPVCSFPFKDQGGIIWQFMRTCPETFQPEKRVFEAWVNIYPDGNCYFDSKEKADQNAYPYITACLHIKQEYGVKK